LKQNIQSVVSEAKGVILFGNTDNYSGHDIKLHHSAYSVMEYRAFSGQRFCVDHGNNAI
jgi:hypothetical protein